VLESLARKNLHAKSVKPMAKRGLYANIAAKRKRIAAGAKERKARPGEKDYPEKGAFKRSAKTAKKRTKKS
jgi:hypothetical protein